MVLENKSNRALRLVTFCLGEEEEEEGVERRLAQTRKCASVDKALKELSKAAPIEFNYVMHWIEIG